MLDRLTFHPRLVSDTRVGAMNLFHELGYPVHLLISSKLAPYVRYFYETSIRSHKQNRQYLERVACDSPHSY